MPSSDPRRLPSILSRVDANTPILAIASERGSVFTAQFAPVDAARIRAGEAATITAQGVAQSVTGHVVAVNSAQGDTRTIPVFIRMSTSSASFGPGAYGSAAIRVGTQSGLIVPKAAVVTDAATGSVQIFRRDGDHFAPVPVTVVDTASNTAIVKASALRPGAVVASDGAFGLLTPQSAPKAEGRLRGRHVARGRFVLGPAF